MEAPIAIGTSTQIIEQLHLKYIKNRGECNSALVLAG
jgi:hypothetical protein